MPVRDPIEIDGALPPFDQYSSLQRLAPARSGHHSSEHTRHQLYSARDRRTAAHVLIKLASRPGLVYQHDLTNEIASLSTINRALPESPYFPFVRDHGQLADGRVYLIASLFDEFPLATSIGTERVPARMVAHLRTAVEVATALAALHGLGIVHVDLNPMNILYRAERGRPVIRIVDFESSYEESRHAAGVFYNPPTTTGFSAPEVSHQAPTASADVFSLGAVVYTMLAGYQPSWDPDIAARVHADLDLDAELAEIVLTATASDPAGRYPSVEAFQTALASYLERIWPGRSW